MAGPLPVSYNRARLCVLLGILILCNSISPSTGFVPNHGRLLLPCRSRCFSSPSLYLPSHHSSRSEVAFRQHRTRQRSSFPPAQKVRLSQSSPGKDDLFDGRTTLSLVGGQSLLIVGAAVAAVLLGTPNWGLGPGVSFGLGSLKAGTLLTLPMAALVAVLDLVEDRFPRLQDVTKATQRSVLGLLGGTFKPLVAACTALALGLAAGFGEEMLFRGVLQYELSARFGAAVGVSISSVVFGLLHAVTPLYAVLAGVASVYFGSIYLVTNNLAVAIVCHAVYDIAALLYAHWTVSRLPPDDRQAIADWEGPGSDSDVLL